MSVIAVGLGIVLPFSSMIDNTVYRTPQISQGERFVTFWKDPKGQRQFGLSLYDNFHYDFFRDNATSFQTVKAWRDASINISDGEYPEVYRSAEIEPDLLSETGVQALLGRIFLPQDVLPGAARVALISYTVWQNYYAGRDDIIGHQGRINGATTTIVGVLPENFGFPISHDLWLPLAVPAVANPGEGLENLLVTGILREDRDIADATQEIQALQTQIIANWPEQYAHIAGSQIVPYIRVVGGQVDSSAVLILMATVTLLVMFNASNLFVARGEERVYELAIRGALGATPGKIALALMLESLLVCLAGLLLGLLLAHFVMSYLDALATSTNHPAYTAFWWNMALDLNMIGMAGIVTLAIWLISGGLPAWRMSCKNLNELLSSGGKGMGDKGTARLNKVLVNMQLVIGCVLLTIGTTTAVTNSSEIMTTLQDGSRLYSGRIMLSTSYHGHAQTQQNFRADLTQALARQADIAGSGFTTAMPGKLTPQVPYTIEDENLAVNNIYPVQYEVSVSENYFALLAIDIVQGRSFSAADNADSLPVAIVDQRLVDLLWPDESVIGKRIKLNPQDQQSPWLTIVGVSAPNRQEPAYRPGDAGTPVLYRSIQQTDSERLYVIYRSEIAGFDYVNALRTAMAQTDRDVPTTEIQSVLQDELAREEQQNANGYISYAFMLIAVYLTGIATYGLAARAVSRRRIETGIRMALGANKASALKVFLADGIKTVAAGLGVGGVLAVVVAYLIMSQISLNGFSMLMQIAVLICLIMGTLVMLANYFPAKKIIAMEPGDALRYE